MKINFKTIAANVDNAIDAAELTQKEFNELLVTHPEYPKPTCKATLSKTQVEFGESIATGSVKVSISVDNKDGKAGSFQPPFAIVQGDTRVLSTDMSPESGGSICYIPPFGVVGEAGVSYNFQVGYTAPPIQNNNIGMEDTSHESHYEACTITEAGSTGGDPITATAKIVARRQVFYTENTTESAVTAATSAEVRAWSNRGANYDTNGSFKVTATVGKKGIAIAIPATKTVVIKDSFGNDNTADFSKRTVSVEGAAGYTAVSYNIYYLVNENGFGGNMVYTITLSGSNANV